MNDIRYGRKRSGIKRELTNKVESWLDSIEDDDVRWIAARNVIVTGGAIASMLLGERINDYDVYFRTREATLKVAEYYVKKFNEAHKLKSVNDYAPIVKGEKIFNIKGEEEDRVIIWM